MRILAVGPHPDDIEFGCAAVLIQEVKNGQEVKILLTSRGESATHGTPEEREEEARAAAREIGAELDFVDLGGDCHVEPTVANRIRMAREIRGFRPDVVLAPAPVENQHPDHTAVGRIVRDAARLARYGGLAELRDVRPHAIGQLYYYAITTHVPDPPQVVVDVSGVFDQWQAVMMCHKSQVVNREYVELVNARARSQGLAVGTQYGVGLWLNDPIRLSSLAELRTSSRRF
jgi:bacillithiol biosynthesis deacetylase BshB1